MKAVVCYQYGSLDALGIEEIDKPSVLDDSLFVGVHASSVNTADLFTLTRMAAIARTLTRPRKPKRDGAGPRLRWDR